VTKLSVLTNKHYQGRTMLSQYAKVTKNEHHYMYVKQLNIKN